MGEAYENREKKEIKIKQDFTGPIFSQKPKYTYKELEDLLIKLKEENIQLKRNSNVQEERIKQVTTKLMRITRDSAGRDGLIRDTDTELLIQDLRDQLRESQKQNDKLAKKLTFLSTQTTPKKSSKWDSVTSRVDTNMKSKKGSPLVNTTGSARTSKASFLSNSSPPQSPRPRQPPDQLVKEEVVHLLTRKVLEQDSEIHQVRVDGDTIRSEVLRMRDEGLRLSEDYRRLQEENHKLQSEINNQATSLTPRYQIKLDGSHPIRSNKDQFSGEMLNLQKDLREKIAKISQLENNLAQSEAQLMALKEYHATLLEQTAALNSALKEEKKKNLQMEQEIKASGSSAATIKELNVMLEDSRAEKKRVEEAHNKLRQTVHTEILEKEKDFDKERQQYKSKIQDMENKIKVLESEGTSGVAQAKQLLEKVEQLRADNDKIRSEKEDLQLKLLELEQLNEELQSKLAFFTEQSGIDVTEIQQAITYLRLKKAGAEEDANNLVDGKGYKEVEELRKSQAELVHELEKMQKMMKLQEGINNDYKNMLEESKNENQKVKREYEQKLADEARLVDIKSEKIRKLEVQLNSLIYKRMRLEEAEMVADEGVNPELHLEDDENALEVHFGIATLAGKYTSDVNTFLAFDFYDYESAISSIMPGHRPNYNFTATYKLKMDDFFLYYLKYHSINLELYQARGLVHIMVGSGFVSFRDILEKNGKIVGTTELISIEDHVTVTATVQWSVRMVRSIAEEIRNWKTKMLASGLSASEQGSAMHERHHQMGSQNRNELFVKINSVQQLESENSKLLCYVFFQFYDFPPYYTNSIHPNDRHLSFEDMQSYPVTITNDLEEYLLTKKLIFVLFDETEKNMDLYLGKAEVPLLSLLKDRTIDTNYPLKNSSGVPVGKIFVELFWKNKYSRLALSNSQTSKLPRPVVDPKVKSHPLVIPSQEPDTQPIPSSKSERSYSIPLPVESLPPVNNTPAPELMSAEEGEEIFEPTPRKNSVSSKEVTPRSELPDIPKKKSSKLPVLVKPSSQEDEDEIPLKKKKPKRKVKPRPTEEKVSSQPPSEPSQDERPLMSVDDLQPAKSKPRKMDSKPVLPPKSPRKPPSRAPSSLSRPSSRASNVSVPTEPTQRLIITIDELELEPVVLDSPDIESIFVSFEFLRYPVDQLETQGIPKHKPLVYNFTRVFLMEPNEYKLYTILSSDVYADANIIFDICNEKVIPGEVETQCIQIGTATINLHKLMDYGADLEKQGIPVRDQYGDIGTLYISVSAVEALKDLLERFKDKEELK